VEGARIFLLDLGSEGVIVEKPNKSGSMMVRVPVYIYIYICGYIYIYIYVYRGLRGARG